MPERDGGNQSYGHQRRPSRPLQDISQNGRVGFEDTFIGDILGVDGSVGLRGNPGMMASIGGARRQPQQAASPVVAATQTGAPTQAVVVADPATQPITDVMEPAVAQPGDATPVPIETTVLDSNGQPLPMDPDSAPIDSPGTAGGAALGMGTLVPMVAAAINESEPTPPSNGNATPKAASAVDDIAPDDGNQQNDRQPQGSRTRRDNRAARQAQAPVTTGASATTPDATPQATTQAAPDPADAPIQTEEVVNRTATLPEGVTTDDKAFTGNQEERLVQAGRTQEGDLIFRDAQRGDYVVKNPNGGSLRAAHQDALLRALQGVRAAVR